MSRESDTYFGAPSPKETLASAVAEEWQRRLDDRDRRIEELSDFLKRLVEFVDRPEGGGLKGDPFWEGLKAEAPAAPNDVDQIALETTKRIFEVDPSKLIGGQSQAFDQVQWIVADAIRRGQEC